MIASCVYEGTIRHRRHEPVSHVLRYPLAMLYLDLDELPAVFAGHPLWTRRVRRTDHLNAGEARALVAERSGVLPEGPVRLLTRPRGLGHRFNPVSFYFCFGADETLHAVIAEVTNTPWGERHRYVLPGTRGEVDKDFHVSPVLGMDHRYAWSVAAPGQRLGVHIAAGATFDATLTLSRRPLDAAGLRRVLWQRPVRPRIYLQALRLKLKGAPYHAHPAS